MTHASTTRGDRSGRGRAGTQALPIHLDRLDAALRAQGVELRRMALLEVAAAAFGHRNSQATTAAARAGRLTPPMAEALGHVTLADGGELVVARDPVAGAPYAVDASFLERVECRGETFGPSPYGHLLDLSGLLGDARPATPPRRAPEPWVAVAARSYGSGDHAHVADAADPVGAALLVGDGLFAWLVATLSARSGCASRAEAVSRLRRAVALADELLVALDAAPGGDDEWDRPGIASWERVATLAFDGGRYAACADLERYDLEAMRYDLRGHADGPGRGLFEALMAELSIEEGCENVYTATSRMVAARDALSSVLDAMPD